MDSTDAILLAGVTVAILALVIVIAVGSIWAGRG